MFNQILEPVSQSLGLTILASLVPLIVLLFLLAVVRMTAWLATIIASIVTIIVGIFLWSTPPVLALKAYFFGALQGLWTIDWIVLLGPSDLQHLGPDRRFRSFQKLDDQPRHG